MQCIQKLLHIYIYATGLICGPPFRVSWVNLRPEELICGPPLPESTVFVIQQMVVFRFSYLFFLQKCHLGGHFARFLWLGKICFFSRLWRLGSWRRTPRGRRTRNASKQGVSEQFGVFVRSTRFGHVAPPWFCTIFENNSCGSYKCVFSEVRIFDQIGFGRQTNGLGLQSWGRFEDDVFHIFSRGGPICDIFGARVCCILVSSRARCQEWPCGCGAEGLCDFSGVVLSTPCSRIWRRSLETPLLFFSCFTLLCVFFLGLGSTQPCMCVLGKFFLSPFVFLFFFDF